MVEISTKMDEGMEGIVVRGCPWCIEKVLIFLASNLQLQLLLGF